MSWRRTVTSTILVGIFFLMIISPVLLGTTGTNDSPVPLTGTSGSRSGLPNDMWPMFRGDAARVGNTTATGPGYIYEVWSLSTNAVWGSPVVMYDQIYISYNGGTRCLDLNGNIIWTFNVGSWYSTPLVFNGSVYICAEDANLYCLDANGTGSGTTTTNWTFRASTVTGARSAYGSPVTDGTRVFYSTSTGEGLHAVYINGTSAGKLAWNASMGESDYVEASPAYWNGRVFCGDGDSYGWGENYLYCYDASDGSLIWKFNAGSNVCSTPAIEYNRVYFGSLGRKVFCLAANETKNPPTKHWEYTTPGVIYGSAAVGYGRVYVADSSRNVHCFNAHATGGTTTRYWVQTMTKSSPNGICSSPAITRNTVYVGFTGNPTDGGAMVSLNRHNGNIISEKYYTGGVYGFSSSPAVYKDMVFANSDNGRLYAFGLDYEPPEVVSTTPVDGAIDVDPDINASIQFDEILNISRLTTSNIIVKDSQGNTVDGDIEYNMGINTVYFNPDPAFAKDETYNITITTEIGDTHDNFLDGNGNGVAEGVGIDEYYFEFTILPFYKPIIGMLNIPKLTEEVPYTVDLTTVITDEDTPDNELNLTEDSPYAELDGFKLTFLYPEGVTHDVVNLTVKDHLFTVWKNIDIYIKAVNDPPVISDIPTLKLTEDIPVSFSLEPYIEDVDTPFTELELYVESEMYGPKDIYFDYQDLYINFTYPNGFTEDIINVTVYEGDISDDLKDNTNFIVEIEPVNDKPTLDAPYEQLVMFEDEADNSVRLSTWFKDVDDNKLTYDYSGQTHVDVTIDASGMVMLEPEPDWTGVEYIDFTATDSGLESVNSTLKVVVLPVNDPPTIKNIISPEDGAVYEFDDTIDLNVEVEDKDLQFGDVLSFYWQSSESGGLAYTQEATGIELEPGIHFITVTVTDENGTEASSSVEITVKEDPNKIVDPDPNDNNTDPDDDDPTDTTGGETKEPEAGSDFIVIFVIIIIIILVIVGMAFAMVSRKRKREQEEAEKPDFQTQLQAALMQPGVPVEQVKIDPQTQAQQTQQVQAQGLQPQMYDQTQYQQYPGQMQMFDQTQNVYPQQAMGFPPLVDQEGIDQTQLQDSAFNIDTLAMPGTELDGQSVPPFQQNYLGQDSKPMLPPTSEENDLFEPSEIEEFNDNLDTETTPETPPESAITDDDPYADPLAKAPHFSFPGQTPKNQKENSE